MRLVIESSRLKIKVSKVSILFVLFVSIEIGTLLLRTSFLFRNFLLLAIGVSCIIYCISRNGIKRNRPFINFVTLYTICGFTSFLINQNANIQQFLWPAAYMGVGLLLLNFKISFQTVKRVYIIVSVVFIIAIVLAGGADNLVMLSSRNTISVYELQLWSIYMISAYQNKKDSKYWAILLGAFVSVISIGRGGILTFSIMLAVYMLYRYDGGEVKVAGLLRIVLCGLGLMILAVLVYYVYPALINQMIYNFQMRGIYSARTFIWEEYFINVRTSTAYILFGAPQRGLFWMDRYAGNLHNSFLQLHAKYGLLMLCIITGVLVKRCVDFFRNKHIYLLVPLIGMVIRMNFDYTNFNAMLDVIIIYFLLYPYYMILSEDEMVKERYRRA